MPRPACGFPVPGFPESAAGRRGPALRHWLPRQMDHRLATGQLLRLGRHAQTKWLWSMSRLPQTICQTASNEPRCSRYRNVHAWAIPY